MSYSDSPLAMAECSKPAGFEHSAIAKGESLYDTARVLSGYSDIIVMRHPEDGSVSEFAAAAANSETEPSSGWRMTMMSE